MEYQDNCAITVPETFKKPGHIYGFCKPLWSNSYNNSIANGLANRMAISGMSKYRYPEQLLSTGHCHDKEYTSTYHASDTSFHVRVVQIGHGIVWQTRQIPGPVGSRMAWRIMADALQPKLRASRRRRNNQTSSQVDWKHARERLRASDYSHQHPGATRHQMEHFKGRGTTSAFKTRFMKGNSYWETKMGTFLGEVPDNTNRFFE